MNSKVVLDIKSNQEERFILNIKDIKNIKNSIELSLEKLIYELEKSIKDKEFKKGKEYYLIANRIYNNNSKINSFGFILYSEEILLDYKKCLTEENNKYKIYRLFNLENRISKLIKRTIYFEKVDLNEKYKDSFKNIRALKNELSKKNLIQQINDILLSIKSEKEFFELLSEVFEYENNFYNSLEFKANIIENSIYKSFKDIKNLKETLDKVYLLFKFNREDNKYEKMNILNELNIINESYSEILEYNNICRNLKSDVYISLNDLKLKIDDIIKNNNIYNNGYIPI